MSVCVHEPLTLPSARWLKRDAPGSHENLTGSPCAWSTRRAIDTPCARSRTACAFRRAARGQVPVRSACAASGFQGPAHS